VKEHLSHLSPCAAGFVKNKIPSISQTHYSSDYALRDFQLFPRLETGLKSHIFESMDIIKYNETAGLTAITKESFQWCF
jgi:hypothetical protein